jgi:hypothetical protein
METNSIPWSKKYFRCICLNSVVNAPSVGRIFSMTKENKLLTTVNTVLTKKNTVLTKFNTVLTKYHTVLTKKNAV